MGKGKTRKIRNGGIVQKKQRGGGEKEDALIAASTDGHIKIVEELLKLKPEDINVNATNDSGNTALNRASIRGHT